MYMQWFEDALNWTVNKKKKCSELILNLTSATRGRGKKTKKQKKRLEKLRNAMPRKKKKKRSGGTFSQLIRLLSNMICYTKKNILEKLSLTEVKPTRISPFAKDRDWVGKRFFKTTVNLI